MTANPGPPAQAVTADVQLSVGGWLWQAKLTVPTAPTPLRTVLPVLQTVADGLVDMAARSAEEGGKQISCKKGCGACCRQLVPISEVEAHHVAALVNAIPEPRQALIRKRFAEARRRLQETGVLDRLLAREGWSDQEFRQVGLDYFRQGVPCPFLEDESCSIHQERPITCREYLVTSPPENCAQPADGGIDGIELPAKIWRLLAMFDKPKPGSPYLRWVPLILALEWAEAHTEEAPLRPGPEWLQELFSRLSAASAAASKTAT